MASMTNWTEEQLDAVTTRVEGLAPRLVALSHAISADPELAYAEHRAAARCADLLEEHAFVVERGAYGQPTAFAARLGGSGPHVVVCAEYDALPGVGHACGHNVIAASAVGAGLALAPFIERAGLRLTILGTPAEEVGGGKVDLLKAGAFEDVDAALMMHPTPFDDYAPKALAIEEWRVVYRGRASHASYAPELGINALDGVVQGYTALAMLRQHLRPLQQVHGVIVDGGAAANVVPERAEASYYLRAVDADDLADLRERARACLEGAATATGTTVEITPEGHVYEPIDAHPGLAAAFTAACAAIGRPYAPDPAGEPISGSTDFGNVSQLVPGLHADMAVDSWPAVNHQHEFAAACVSESGDRTMLDGAKALALTALAVAEDPALLSR
ncbi:MAG: N-acyl-L-amino acid amidohydrolase [uncultured Nocardioidaceae bacterium]|uniref:Peptidase M20 domain-containing protein 2 n=1 Tax=uncultured Nocardioidaceae bacterium TaxID=253824 RepID=A0A6J4LU70_9ACTN|nr:MAG: N-acyl-L-amino acid amidohydrolase [uncultured Nocardioidaceae bacterium]